MILRFVSPLASTSLPRRALSVAVLSALLGTPMFAAAQVTPDPNAGAHRPSTDRAANGTPVVNIVTPSAAGVSHNQYQQFNVDPKGLILNNAAGVSQTQLGGYIVGNPNYRPGQSARLIVNEVTSTNPSYLRGYTEVAGNAADVVISNPNGISVNGGGFINTNRATLTTGVPIFDGDGSLSAFRVTRGNISVDGDGLSTSNIDRLDLITRSLAINGKVWANNLNVVAGTHQVNASDLSMQAIDGDGDAAAIAIDVGALGGIYGNHVNLIANGAGIGVNNAGELASLGTGDDFTLTSDGQLVLTGKTSSAGNLSLNGSSLNHSGAMQATGNIALQTHGDLTNSGTLYGGGDVNLRVGGVLTNSNVIAAANNANLAAQRLTSSGTLGAGVTPDGSLQGSGALNVMTTGGLSANGSNLASGSITLQGSALDLSGATTHAGSDMALISTVGDIDHRNAMLATKGALTLNSAGTVNNTGGTLQAGQLAIQSNAFQNVYGSVAQTGSAPMNVRIAGMLDNTHGTWVANARDMAISAGTLDNTAGAIEHAGAGTLSLTTGALTNTQGQIVGNGNLALSSRATVNNGGTISMAGDAALAGTDLDNTSGTFIAQNIHAELDGTVSNAGGLLQANSTLLLAANALNNGSGQIKARNGNLTLSATQMLSNDTGGFIGSNGAVNLSSDNLNNAGQMYAGSNLALTTQGDAVNSGALQAQGSLNAKVAGTLTNNHGQLEAGTGQGGATLTVNAATLSNQGGRIANTDNGATTITSRTLDNTGGTLGGQGHVQLNAAQLTNTDGTLVSGGDFVLQSDYLANHGGTLYSAGRLSWNNRAATLDNTDGSLGAGGDIALALDTLHNDGGEVAANANVTTQLNGFDGIGRLRAGQDLSLTLAGDYTQQAGNTLFANNNFTFNLGGTLTNASGAALQAVGALTVNAAQLDNQYGAHINSGTTTITTSGSQSNEGRLEGDNVALNAADITNTGTIIGNAITLNANRLTNGADLGTQTDNNPYQTGLIAAVNTLHLYITGDLLNRDAMLYSLGDLTIAADANGSRSNSVTNLSGDIEAGGDIFIATQQFTNERRVLTTETHTLTPAEQAANSTTSTTIFDWTTDAEATAFCNAYAQTTGEHGHAVRCGPLGYYGDAAYDTLTQAILSITRLTATSAESRLLAGGNITLAGSVLNSNSTIAAGNNLIINGQDGNAGGGQVGGDTVQNIAFVPTVVVQNDLVRSVDGDYEGSRWYSNRENGLPPMVFAEYTTSAALAAGSVPFLTLDAGPSLSATMSAGHAVDITAKEVSNTVVDADGRPVSGVDLGANAGGSPITGQPGRGAQTIGDSTSPLGPITLPSNGLYSVRPGNGSPYLVETDPRFATLSGFLGSDYLLNQLGLQGDLMLKRLGDAFYETQRVMDQITSLTGLRYLDNNADALDQYKALMDAGAQQAQEFNLAVGVALTPKQMASLTRDMVWLVNETVNGEQVLVPVVYLSQQTANNVASGAVIQGSTVTINAVNQLTNTGVIQASQDASLQASNLLNAGQLSAGGNLTAQAAQDLLNAGNIQGGNVALTAGNNLLSSADAGNVNLGSVNLSGLSLTEAQRGGIATGGHISATDTLTAQAGNNLSLDHASISAGNNLGLAAGNDLTATASTLTAGTDTQLIAGNNIDLNTAAGQGSGQQDGNSASPSTHTDVTTLTAGGSAMLAAGNDLTSQGAQLQAGDQLALSAGHDVILNAVADVQSQGSSQKVGKTQYSQYSTDQHALGTTVHAADGVAISAGHDLSATAGVVTSTNGDVALAAGNNLNLIAAQETHIESQDSSTKTSGFLSSSKTITHDASSNTYAVGTQISGNSVSLAAGNDLTAQAAYLNANNALTLAAGHDINLTDAQDLHSEEHDFEHSSFSFFSTSSKRFGSVDPEWRSNSSSTQINQSASVGSVLSGDSVTVAAGNNLIATNTQVVATNDVVLAAGNNLTLNAGRNTYDLSQNQGSSHTGLMNNGGLSVLIGNRSTKDDLTVNETSYIGSTVGSLNGRVTLSASNDVHVTGSDILSQTGTAIVGKNVTIDAAVGSTDITQTQKVSQGGINVGVGGAAGAVANAVSYSAQRAGQVQDDRLKALYAAQAAQALFSPGAAQGMNLSGGQDGYDAISNAAQGKAGIDFKIGIGGSSASNTMSSHDETTYGSRISSNGDLTIAATGGDLNIIGSQISGQDVAFAAASNLNLLSQAENHSLQSNNQNTSTGVGVLIGSSGFGIYAEAAVGKGNVHGNGVTHTDTTVNADGTLTLISGNDTTIKGAQLTGDTVLAAIGNNLLIQSEQDTDDYASKQWQANGQVVIGFGGMSSGGGLSYNQSKMDSHYQSVTDVSGISAGSGGFDITVGGNTHLIGGVIASSAGPGKNILDTGSLTYESIHNEANYSANSIGIGGGYGGGGFSGGPSLGVPQRGNSSSKTNAGIAQGTIIVRDGNADLSGLDRNPMLDNQALTPIFDAQKVQEKMEMGQVAGQVGMTAAGDFATEMGWAEGSPQRTILHGVVGAGIAALGGGDVAQGALGAAANQSVIQQMANYLAEQGYEPGTPEFTTMMQLASTAVGAAVGGNSGATTALDGTKYNYLTHLQLVKANKDWEACRDDQVCQARVLSEAQDLSQKNDAALRGLCSQSPGSDACKSAINDATAYGALWGQNGYALQSDMARSVNELMGYLMSTQDGYQYYPALDSRKDFFQAFQNALVINGNEVVWPQVAANTSDRLQSVNDWYCMGCNGASAWVDEVGKAIMKFEWPEFQKLYTGAALTGDAARFWDTSTLLQEQMTLQPFYDRLSNQAGWPYDVIYSGGYLNTGTDIFNLYNRVDYGLDQLDLTREKR